MDQLPALAKTTSRQLFNNYMLKQGLLQADAQSPLINFCPASIRNAPANPVNSHTG